MAHLKRSKYFNVVGRGDIFGGVVISKVGILCENDHISDKYLGLILRTGNLTEIL